MDAAHRALPRRKRLFLSILLGTLIVLLLALAWARVTETVPSTAYVVGFYGLLGLFFVAFYLIYRWTPGNAQRRAASLSPRPGDAGFDTRRLKDRLRDAATAPPTPGAFAVFAIVMAFAWAAVAFSLAVTAYTYVGGSFDLSMVCFLSTLGPAVVVVVLWMAYARGRFVRMFLEPPAEEVAEPVHAPKIPTAPSAVSLTLPRGLLYQRLWRGPATALLVPLLFALALAFGLVSSSGQTAAPWVLLGLCVPLLMTLVPLAYYRVDRTIVADSRGVRLTVGHHLSRTLAWDEIRSIQQGWQTMRMGLMGTYAGTLLVVLKKRGGRLYLFDGYFHVAPDAFPLFIRALSLMANQHAVPVSEVASGWTIKGVGRSKW